MGRRIGSRSRSAWRTRLLCVLLCAAAGLLALGPASAAAATLAKGGAALTYTAASGEQNHLVVSLATGTYTFDDTGATITAASDCTRVNATRATCPASGVTSISVDTGNSNDLAWNTSATTPPVQPQSLNAWDFALVLGPGRAAQSATHFSSAHLVPLLRCSNTAKELTDY